MTLRIVDANESPISRVKSILAVASGKGGVGKSTVTVSLASSLRQLGLKVGIIDADIYGPSIMTMLPPGEPPREEGDTLIPSKILGMEVISMNSFHTFGPSTIVRAPIANAIIQQFVHKVAWSELDVILIDFPPGTGDIQLTLMQTISITGAVLVTLPNEVSASDVRKSSVMFKQLEIPIIGIIENMSYFEDPLSKERHYLFGKGAGKILAEEEQVKFLGCLPVEPEIAHLLDEGKSIFSYPKRKHFTDKVLDLSVELSAILCDHIGQRDAKMSFKEMDQFSFELIKGEEIKVLSAFDVQNKCPCARCVDEITGSRIVQAKDHRVRFSEIKQVGSFGLRFQFSSGCSKGIYHWNILWDQ